MPEPSSVRGPATIRCAPTSTSATSALVVSMNDVDSVVGTSTEEPVRPSPVKEPEPTALTVRWTDRMSVVQGKGVSVRVDTGGRRIFTKNINLQSHTQDDWQNRTK